MTSGEFEGWNTLDKRTLAVTALTMAGAAVGAAIPITAAIVGGGGRFWVVLAWVFAGGVVLVGGGVLADLFYWKGVRYRVTPDRLETAFTLIFRSRKSLQRERIRNVDLTANPLHRLFGVAVVTIGTGSHESGGQGRIKLNPVSRAEAERLRADLLRRAEIAETDVDAPLAELDLSWIRYAPMSFVTPTLGLAAGGGLMQISEWAGLQKGLIDWVIGLFRGIPLVAAILILLAIVMVVGLVGALGLWVEMWWNYRLDREPGGTLRVRRGLFTTRSISIEERRMRGIDLVEPLGNRISGAARVDAIATGMRQSDDKDKTDYHTLLPAVPVATANRVAAAVLREPVSPAEAVRLTGHPRAARGRLLRWWVGSVVVLLAIFAILGFLLTDVLLVIGAALGVVLLPASVLLALDAYRNLGHGITGRYLVGRHGTVRRSTFALERDGVIGWTVKQSIFQRRKGLLTVVATTAAGGGAYSVYDAGEEQGLLFAEESVPELLTPFLERA
ncbi:PH domain-containing protein [Amycolatopsis decaplanina]|uniref:Membrane-flanked domain-containing protein n=1 Tax=Amycolatopsis decaplanina DSM 44594 TaxID=1284240 RepID=M2Z8L9_9PSEU|nr:PH domain-containing protein [Amycolatopsis decaplanina]EME57208.1 membrane-flanked domain-containing protein [Amycolatopsis decaplanina DSM 44594]